MVDDVLRALKEPFENKTRIVNPGELLLQRLKCIRALTPLFNNTHAKIVKDILVELTQRNIHANMSDKSRVRYSSSFFVDHVIVAEWDSFLQIILEQLEILTALSEKNVSWLSDNLGVVLGISLSVASYGLPHHIDSVPRYLLPTSLLFPDSKPNTNKVSSELKSANA